MPIIARIVQMHDDLTSWRRDIHAHPELGFEEQRTSDLVASKLAEFGCEVYRGIGKTGLVGRLRVGNSPRSVGLRADMDALPIQEANDFDHRSRHDGRMHACGHDGHTTMLLGAARYLAETRNFDGTVNFIFQPAEEGLGGAEAMVKEGIFDRFPCDTIFGMHNSPGLAIGKFAIRSGPMMAGGGFFDISVLGRGAHGARPESGVDPVIAASHIAAALQTIVSRNVRPVDTAVVSVTRFHAGDAYNVIPERAVIGGTVRAFDNATFALIEQNMKRIANGIASGFGAETDVDFRSLFPPLINDAAEAAFVAETAAELVGAENIERNPSLVMASEDFSHMLNQRPGAYIRIGNGDTPGACQVHNPGYDFNDAALPIGASLFARVAERKLARS
ncbi:MAG: amidohydrolase [Alphaproteobacteria bacterium]|nr:amidohydrolase [Alphaproteobacteria bacterium]MBV8335858.1 amidohydrolase [Alphaproteobacteria bacterium]